MIQTEFPEHPLLKRLITEGYESFAGSALEERREAGWPPYSRLALLRAEAKDSAGSRRLPARREQPRPAAACHRQNLRARQRPDRAPGRSFPRAFADRNRVRSTLQRFLQPWLPQVEMLPGPPGLRWSIDVDPLEVD